MDIDFIDLDDQIDCVRREIIKRKEVYPRLVAAKKLSQERADREIAMMRAALSTLMWAADRDSAASFFGDEPETLLEDEPVAAAAE